MWNKIIAPTLLVVVFWLAFSGAVVISMYRMEQFHARVVAENVITIQAANALSDAVWRILAITLAADPACVDETSKAISNLERQFESHLRVAEETSFTVEEQQLSRIVRDRITEFSAKRKERMDASHRADSAVSLTASNAQLLGVSRPCIELRAVNERLASAASDRQSRFIALSR